MSSHKKGQPRSPGERAGLDRNAVLAEARRVLVEKGARDLTMRELARRLGVAPNTLYSHIEDKGELWDLVIDDILGDVPLPEDADTDPVRTIRDLMAASFDVLIAHADVMPQVLTRQGARGVNAQRLGSIAVNALKAAGVADEEAPEALRVLIVNTVGFAAFATEGGLLSIEEIRANHMRSLDWLLAGITS